MTITEPATMLTDYLLAIASLLFAVLTFRRRSSHRAMDLWILAFTCAAIAALIGGTFHGFRLHFSESAAKSLWDTTMIFIGATTGFLIAATIVSSLRDGKKPRVQWLKRGIVVSGLGVAFQKIGWAPSPSFNHNDVYHLVQIAGFWCFYEGIKRLK
jgi:hypothetical protein